MQGITFAKLVSSLGISYVFGKACMAIHSIMVMIKRNFNLIMKFLLFSQ